MGAKFDIVDIPDDMKEESSKYRLSLIEKAVEEDDSIMESYLDGKEPSIEEIKKCFALYIKFPKNRWSEIEKAEKDDEEGNKIFTQLSEEYLEKYMPAPNADPHGGIEDFIEVDKLDHCIPIPKKKRGSSSR